jgi:hypothetical protein
MSQPYSNQPSQRSPWFYAAWGCGGCACLSGIAVVVGVFMLSWGVKKGIESLAESARAAQVDLKVQKHELVQKEGKRYIVGTLKNISPKNTYSNAFVEFSLFDKTGKPLEGAIAKTTDLKPGATWDFKAPVTDPTAATYKFRAVSGFQEIPDDPTLDPATRQRNKAQREEMRRRMQDIFDKAKADSEQSKPTDKP